MPQEFIVAKFEKKPMTPEHEEIRHYIERFERGLDYWYPDRERHVRNMRMYWAVDYAQWPQYVVDRLRSQGRNAPSYNVVRSKLEGLAGLLLKNQLDVKFDPIGGKYSSLTLRLQDMYYSDRELMDWDASYHDFLIFFLIQFGVEQMVISDRFDPMGNIGFESVNPIMWMPDPNWKSPHPRDLEYCFKQSYLTAKQIQEIFPNKIEELEDARRLQALEGDNYGEYRSPHSYLYKDLDSKWGSRYLVNEYHYTQVEERFVEYNKKNGEMFPEGDFDVKLEYAQRKQLTADDIMWQKEKKHVYYVKTFAKGMTERVFLEDRKHEIQINRLPFFPLGVSRFNGQYSGMVDDLYDVQQNINKNEMDMTDIRQRAAKGAVFIDPDIVDQDPIEMERIESEWNNPGFRMWTRPGALAEGRSYTAEMPKGLIPPDLVQNTERMYELADRLSKQPAAAEARTEGAGESGRLFTAKYEAGLIAQGTMYKNVEQHWNDKGEAYMLQAQITYAGVEREFPLAGGKGSFKINEYVPFNGGVGIHNDISKLARHKVTITQSPKGLNISSQQRIVHSEIVKMLGPGDGLLRVTFMDRILDSLELTDEQKEEDRRLFKLLKMREGLAVMKDIRALQVEIKQAEAMVQQLTGSAGGGGMPDMGGGGGGGPGPGGGAAPGREAPEQITMLEPAGGGGVLPSASPTDLSAGAGTPQQKTSEISQMIEKFQRTKPI